MRSFRLSQGRGFVAALCLLTALPPANATAPGDPLTTITVTGTRLPVDQGRAPVQTQVVTEEALRATGATNLEEALVDLGLCSSTNGMGSAITLQGMSGERVLILVDGRRIVGRVASNLDARELALGDIERIEIIKGPQSALYGSDALGGVINIITKRPKATPSFVLDARNAALPQGESPDGVARAYLREQVGTAALDLPLGPSSNRLSVSGARAFAYRDAGGKGIYPETGRVSAALRSSIKLSAGAAVEAGGSFTLTRQDDYTSMGGSYARIEGSRGEASAQVDIPMDSGSALGFGLNYQLFTRSKSSFNALLDATSDGGKERQDYAALEASYSSFLGDSHELMLFAQGSYDRLEKYNIADGSPNDRLSFAVVAQDEWIVSGGASLVGGLRAEYSSDYGFFAAPKLSGRVELADGLRLLPAVGLGYRAPSFLELYLDTTGSVYHKLGNPELRPEKSVGGSLGLDWFPGPATLQASIYHNELFDEIAYDYSGGHNGAGLHVIVKRNLTRSSRSGVDLSASASPTSWLDLGLRYGYLLAWDRSSDTAIEDRSAHSSGAWAKASAGKRGPSLRLSADLSSPYARRTTWLLVMGARIETMIAESLELYCGADNLTGAVDSYAGLIVGPELYLGLRLTIR